MPETEPTRTPWTIDGDLILGPDGSGTDYEIPSADGRSSTHHAIVASQEHLDRKRWAVDAPIVCAARESLDACRQLAHDIEQLDDDAKGRIPMTLWATLAVMVPAAIAAHDREAAQMGGGS